MIKKQLRKVGIFQRLNLCFLLILIAALFLTFFSFHQYFKELNLNLDRYVTLLVQNVDLKVQDTMKEYEDIALRFYDDSEIIVALSENAELSDARTAEEQERFARNTYLVESRLYSMRLNQKHLISIQFVTPDRQYHMSDSNGFRHGCTIRDLDAFYRSDFYTLPQQKNGYPVWMDSRTQTDFFFKTDDSHYGLNHIITMGIAVYEPADRNFLGVLLFNIDLDTFSDSIDGYNAYSDGNTFLIGESGVLTWFNPSISAPSFPKNPALFAQMSETEQNILRFSADGQNVLLAYKQIPETQMFACYIANLNVLLEHAYHVRNLCIAVLICIIIVCFVLSYFVTNSISDPIRELIRVMHKTGKGKWTERYENSGNDEITILGNCFNKMAENTNQLLDQVYVSEIKRQRTLLSWKNAQLNALLMQINPHFLYNTLDIIRWEAMYEANGESPVTQMIEKFSRLCRMGMRTGGNTIPLSEGIEHASTYIDVINFRHSDKIELLVDIKPEAESLYVPQFMLQPIMENAVVHAFDGASRGYCIKIQALVMEQTLHITVEDNGRGMTPDELEHLCSLLSLAEVTDKNIGLVNVHQRIRLFYGESYGIRITSEPENGTTVQITLPMRTHSENMADNTGGTNEL